MMMMMIRLRRLYQWQQIVVGLVWVLDDSKVDVVVDTFVFDMMMVVERMWMELV